MPVLSRSVEPRIVRLSKDFVFAITGARSVVIQGRAAYISSAPIWPRSEGFPLWTIG